MSNHTHTLIIAEAGVNHNGSLSMAKQLIDVAVDAGADIVKFQTFKTEDVVTKSAPKAKYQQVNTNNAGSQYEMIKALELSYDDFQVLNDYCKDKEITFLSTPFDLESLHFLVNRLDIPFIKIASGEITNGPFLLAAARTGKPIILSTGMSHLMEVEAALSLLAFGYTNQSALINSDALEKAYKSTEGKLALEEKVSILHCTTEYPAQFHHVNLRAIKTLANVFNLRVGYSDHTLGVEASIAAVAMGATIIEKHFTLDQNLSGPDHKASLEPHELKMLVQFIRHIEQAVGSGIKKPMPCELETLKVARRSLIANTAIDQGEYFTSVNMIAKRPGTGISPMYYWDYLSKIANKNYDKDEIIS